jgi:hypothetical protein
LSELSCRGSAKKANGERASARHSGERSLIGGFCIATANAKSATEQFHKVAISFQNAEFSSGESRWAVLSNGDRESAANLVSDVSRPGSKPTGEVADGRRVANTSVNRGNDLDRALVWDYMSYCVAQKVGLYVLLYQSVWSDGTTAAFRQLLVRGEDVDISAQILRTQRPEKAEARGGAIVTEQQRFSRGSLSSVVGKIVGSEGTVILR